MYTVPMSYVGIDAAETIDSSVATVSLGTTANRIASMTSRLRSCLDSEDDAVAKSRTNGFGRGAGSEHLDGRPGNWSIRE